MSSTESFWTFETDKAAHRHITSYAEVWACSLKACRVGEKLYTLLWQAPAPAYLRTLLQQVSQSLCVRVSGGFYKSSNTDIWLLWSNSKNRILPCWFKNRSFSHLHTAARMMTTWISGWGFSSLIADSVSLACMKLSHHSSLPLKSLQISRHFYSQTKTKQTQGKK